MYENFKNVEVEEKHEIFLQIQPYCNLIRLSALCELECKVRKRTF